MNIPNPKTLTETANYRSDLPEGSISDLYKLYFSSQQFMYTAKSIRPVKDVAHFPFAINVSVHNVGVAFELMFKTILLLDKVKMRKTHSFETLYCLLTNDSKANISRIVKNCSWKNTEQFIKYIDDEIDHPDRRYMSVYYTAELLWWNDDRNLQKSLIGLDRVYKRISNWVKGRIWIDPELPLEWW